MSSPKRIQPGETIGLKLGVSERLSIQKLTMVDSEIAERVAKAPKSQPRIPFTLDELDDLIGHVAADLNHTKDENRQYWLEKQFSEPSLSPNELGKPVRSQLPPSHPPLLRGIRLTFGRSLRPARLA